MSAVSLDDLKTFLSTGLGGNGIGNSNSNDDELLAMLDRAEAIIATRVGPLEPTEIAGELHTGPGPLLLKHWPLISLGTVTTGGATVADQYLDVDGGLLYGTFSPVSRATTVSYTAGREWLPADLQAAVLELVRHLWLTQRVPGTRRGFSAGEPDERTVQGISNYLLPYRVQTLIEPYLLPRLA